ncbi:RICIN domain-containing protein [Kitasatospora sp. NPDC101235]|uniref:RICIN domain-containing protein n=1 Tax=Kitasatospora sp. NPDC101235 TaxID=3364101 RepID=UPI003819D9A7
MATPSRTRLTRRLAAFGTALLAAEAAVPLAAAPAAAAVAPVCMSGKLVYDYPNAEEGPDKPVRTKPVRNANIELWGRETMTTPARRLNSDVAYTSSDGSIKACYTPAVPTTMEIMWVTVKAENNRLWKVVDKNGDTWSGVGSFAYDVSASVDTGTTRLSTDWSRAFHVFDTVNTLWQGRANPGGPCWTAQESNPATCTELTYQWYPGSTFGPVYTLDNTIHLPDTDPDSEHTVLHEGGHFLMHRLYNGTMPADSVCGDHYIWAATTRASCAWVEGFADATAAYLLGDNRYVWSNGSSTAFTYGGGWDVGDLVSGNITGALLDLWRKTDGGWDATIKALAANRPNTFAEYFRNTRPAAVPPLATTGAALDHPARHAIDYGPVVGDGRYYSLTDGNGLALERDGGCAATNRPRGALNASDASRPSQRWRLDPNPDGTVRIYDNCSASLTLTADFSNPPRAVLRPYNPSDRYQKWRVTQNTSGTLTITTDNGYSALDCPGSQAGDDAQIRGADSRVKTQNWAAVP